jgi:hypothetical protein
MLGEGYEPLTEYLFLDEKRKLKLVSKIKKLLLNLKSLTQNLVLQLVDNQSQNLTLVRSVKNPKH